MAGKPRIGSYQHRPEPAFTPGPDGTPRPVRVRKRFPHLGLVPLVHAVCGTLVCALLSWGFRAMGMGRILPQRVSDARLPPAPTLDNVIFGAGFPETAVACGLIGFWLWTSVWKTRVSREQQAEGFRGVFRALLSSALGFGALLSFAALPIGAFGLYLRTAPAEQPWPVRPFFALYATPVLAVNALLTGVIPLVILALGLLSGLVTAVAPACIWRDYPEEPSAR
ncbi:MAG: hypothetical protein ACO1SX_04075 [Actinomycetota bacterium]